MEDTSTKTLRELLNYIKCRPGVAFLDHNRQRIDYLIYYLHGYCASAGGEINYRYYVGMARWIHNWIIKNKNSDVEFSFLWFEMIYSVTSTEEEAWELFFRLSYEYLDQLEAELGKSPSDVQQPSQQPLKSREPDFGGCSRK